MFLLTPEEAAVFELLDPSSRRRLVLGRTGRAFVWDPIDSTREVPFAAAQSLVKAGIVGAGGRIAAEHLAQWRKPSAASSRPALAKSERKATQRAEMSSLASIFERTLPVARSAEALRAM